MRECHYAKTSKNSHKCHQVSEGICVICHILRVAMYTVRVSAHPSVPSSGLQTGTQFPSMFSFCVGIPVAVSDACTVACIMHTSANGN